VVVMQTTSAKGDALEEAVRAIETAIVRSFPGYSESAFRIQGKRILFVSGVHHEIDLFVTAAMGPGYEAVFVFECKNWQDKVGKNEIVVFSEKVKAANAQRGFFVAKSFTADAVAQAAQDRRLELLLAAELDPSAVMVPAGFHSIFLGETNAGVSIRMTGASSDAVALPIDLDAASFSLGSESANLKTYVNAWVDKARHARCDHFPSVLAAEGVHVLEFNDARNFDEDRASVNDQPVSIMTLTGTVKVQVCKAVVVSAFEVASRGRVITVQIDGPAVQLKGEFVQLTRAGMSA
jgi:Restriction endonuclease